MADEGQPAIDNERALVELVAATAACQSSPDPIEATLRDIKLPEALRDEAEARMLAPNAFANAEPDATPLLDRPEDGFVSALSITLVPRELRDRRRLAVIARPFGFVQTLKDVRIAVIAPTRYETDFASIPIWARWLISPFGKHAEPAVVHDWLYALGEPGDVAGRRQADDVFRLALRGAGVSIIKRNIMHWAVRIGGGGAYGQDSEFRFRRMRDLTVITPPPVRAAYRRTIARRPR